MPDGAYLLTGQSDLSGWKEEWKNKVFNKMKENKETQYIFLTKRPENIKINETPDNGWFGVTVTSSKEKYKGKTMIVGSVTDGYNYFIL